MMILNKLWRCSVCGYVHEGDQAPDKCPKCGAPKEKFIEIYEDDAKKIYNSDRTNDIHMKIINLADEMIELCKEGIEIDLDPGCVSTFEKAKDEGWVIKQRCKAELETHMKKGKW